MSGLGITLDRSEAVNFTTPYHFQQISFITRRSKEKSKTFAMIYPFTLMVWICLLVALLMLATFIYFTEHLHSKMNGESSPKIIKIIWYFYGSLVGKSGKASVFKAPGVRLLLGVWWVATITILSFYSSLLTSFITYPGFETQIDTFESLVEAVNQNEIEAGSIIGSAPYAMIKEGKSFFSRTLKESIKRNETRNLVRSISEGVKLVTERNYAFIFTKTSLEAEAYENYRDEMLFISEDSMYTALGGMALSSNFKCSHTVNKYVKRFLSMGFFAKWNKDSLEATQRSIGLNKEATALTTKDLQGAFYVMLLGLLIATISCFFENLVIM
ncbi:unnamed protein product [Larinioides sclopetarius]